MVTETLKCAHEPCLCTVEAEFAEQELEESELRFCGGYCYRASDREEEEACACGHPPCDTP
jgi:hypothetical protein